MSRKKNTYLAAGAGLLLVAGLSGAAFAASNTVPDGNAGQGNADVAGFSISNIDYSTDDLGSTDLSPTVDDVTFDIVRDGTTSSTPVTEDNADVYVQLRTADGNSVWVSCSVSTDAAACDTASQNITIVDLADISVAAYDAGPVT